jgi:hypothetical protein
MAERIANSNNRKEGILMCSRKDGGKMNIPVSTIRLTVRMENSNNRKEGILLDSKVENIA